MTFKELSLEEFNYSYLSEYFIYLLTSPVTVFLWQGNEVLDEIKNFSLSVIKAFYQEK